ncbi:MAG: glycosyltransferase family 4 protein [Candidatus Lokiarchaeota archaeon]|nr:glycosyltransferase family 4 protein [Candidatus Lokiarchaeota archaeon]
MRIQLHKPFDVGYFTPRFFPAIAGGEFYILNLARQMLEHKDNPLIYCSTSIDFKGIRTPKGLHISSEHPNYYSYMKIPLKRLNPEYSTRSSTLKHIFNHLEIPYNPIFANLLKIGPNHSQFFSEIMNLNKKELKKHHIIHSTYLPYATILFAYIYSRILGVPSICTPFFHIYNPRYQEQTYISLLRLFEKIIACTHTEKKFLVDNGLTPQRIEVIPMGVDPELYKTRILTHSGKVKSFSKFYNLSHPFVLFCGHKNYEKGAISVLQAALIAKKDIGDLIYVFIGPSTPAFDIELKKARRQGLKVLNLTPDNLSGYYDWRKISAFQECEFYIMPSRSDAYGIAYLEAWASKKSVIGADNPVMREVIRHEKDGILVEFDNISQIAENIVFLCNNPDITEEMGFLGYSKINRSNNWDYIYRCTMDVYKQLVKFDA